VGRTFSLLCVVRKFAMDLQQQFDKQVILFFVSAPEHVLLDAQVCIEGKGGFTAAFTRNDLGSPKKNGVCQILRRLFVTANSTNKARSLLNDFVASWTIQERWKMVWFGRVRQGLETLIKIKGQNKVVVIAIKGGRQCDWEQEQLSPGGELHTLFPDTPLIIFKDLDELVNFVEKRTYPDPCNRLGFQRSTQRDASNQARDHHRDVR